MSVWWKPWPHILAALAVGGGAVAGAVATDGDPKALAVGGAAVVATAYALVRRFRR